MHLADYTIQTFQDKVHPVAPPLNLQATQASASAPAQRRLARVFHLVGQLTMEFNASFPSAFTYVGLTLNNYSVGQSVSVRSEADQLAIESTHHCHCYN